ncbi:MAG: ABC transporter ATP-binding protein [Actinomycetes bacterium]
MTVVVEIEDVAKRFVIRKDKSLKERLVNRGRSLRHRDEFWALDGVTLSIDAGTTVGLIGPNGSGKSTLLKTIGGIIQPNRGTVRRRGRLAALLELGAGFHPDLTGRENVYLNAAILGLSRETTDRHFDEIVDFSGIERFIDTQVKFYSSGMYVRLAFAVAVHVDPDLLLVDEVLAVGDEPFQRKCMERIRRFQREGRTIVVVSHALDQIGELCDRAVVLESGRVVVDGEPRDALRTLRSDYETARQEDEARQQRRTGQPQTEALVESVRLLDVQGEPCDAVRAGDDVVVEVAVRAVAPLRAWVVGIGIDTPLGQVVYGTHTGLLGAPLPDMAAGESRVVRLVLPDLRLGQGEYFVHGAVAHADGGEIHRLSPGAMLTVRSVGDGVGPVDVRARVLTTGLGGGDA